MPQVRSEDVFNRGAAAHALPLLDDGADAASYIEAHATTDETARCFTEAFAAAAVADHVTLAQWLSQARNTYVPPARTKTRG